MKIGPIVQVVTSGSVAGGQLVSLEVSRRLAQRGHSIRFASPSEGPFIALAAQAGETDIVRGSSVREIHRVAAMAGYLRRVNAALVHTHTPAAATILWRIAARIARVPIVNHVHIANFYGPPGAKSSFVARLDRLTATIPSAFIAVSRHTRESLVADGYPADRIVTLYNSIPWPREERKRQTSSDDTIVGCVGRLYPAKGQARLIEAFAQIVRRNPGAKLWIVGDADGGDTAYADSLRSLVSELDVDESVTFWGHRADVRDLIRQFTVIALPSLHEAFPLVLLEAMSVGVPVVASPVGGVPELVENGMTGLLVNPLATDELARVLERLLEDAELRESLSAAAYDSVWERFTPASGFDAAAQLIEKEASSASVH